MDMSLDDIIKTKNKKRGPQNSKWRTQNAGVDRRNNRGNNIQNKGRQFANKPLQNSTGNNKFANKPARRNNSGKIVDARMKIIQKNRKKITDAREKLISLAKQTDARNKIKGKAVNSRRNINGRQTTTRGGNQNTPRGNIPRKNPPVLLQRSIRNNLVQANDLLRFTINRPIVNYGDEMSNMYVDETDVDMPLASRTPNDLSGIKIVTQNEYLSYGQDYSRGSQDPMYLDYEPSAYTRQLEPPRRLSLGGSRVRMSQEMRARLDTPPPPVISRPSGLFSWQPTAPSSPTPAPQPQGYRIVVSNLHSSVTDEDIKELFTDIGPLITSRLVRPGTAEVIYKYQRDAKKAVEVYHNRQLDQLPMKCMLVNPRPPTESSGILRPSVLPAPPKFPSSNKSTVVPDISAIHKALFMNK